MLSAMAGHDPKDSTSAPDEMPDLTKALSCGVKGMKIGIPAEYEMDGMDPEIVALWQQGQTWMVEAGAELVEISLPHTKYALPAYYIIALPKPRQIWHAMTGSDTGCEPMMCSRLTICMKKPGSRIWR